MLILEDALQKFELLDPEVVFTVNSDRFIRKISELSKKYSVDLNAAVLFSVVGDLKPEDLAGYLAQEQGVDEGKAKLVANELKSQVLKPMEARLLLLNADPDKVGITSEQEKEALKQIFSEELVWEMSEYDLIKNAVNYRIFDILEKDLNFKRELERSLYENKESLTENPLVIAGKTVDPTIDNWLKDFIEKKGTDDFNTVALSDYLANSANAKNLSPEEKNKLSDLLNLYRNIKFFPATVAGKTIDEWQIIPFDLAAAQDLIKKENKKLPTDEEIESEETLEQPSAEPTELTLDQKLSQYDWNKIIGIERRARLEELGVGLKDFVKWLAAKK
ncbi:MAG: hypothetical protein WC517_02920 [Patescibacteria group bacterium]